MASALAWELITFPDEKYDKREKEAWYCLSSQTNGQESAQWNGVGAIQDRIVKEWGERSNKRRLEQFARPSDRKTSAYQFTTVPQFKHIYNTAIYFPRFLFQWCTASYIYIYFLLIRGLSPSSVFEFWISPKFALLVGIQFLGFSSFSISVFRDLPIQHFTLSPKYSLCPMVPIIFVSTWNYPLG